MFSSIIAQSKRGFTLIELLVVITIIGILATGSVAVYTSQIQKARDTNRMNDMKAVQSGVEQYYQDNSYYPAANSITGITVYVPQLPKDPKSWETCNKWTLIATACDYIYNVSTDANGILQGEYKVSIGLESDANVAAKAAKDDGQTDEANRFEIGLNINSSVAAQKKSTICNRTSKVTVPNSWKALDNTLCNWGGTIDTNAVFIAK